MPILAAYEQRQGPPLERSPAHRRALCEQFEQGLVPWHCSEVVLAPSPIRTLSMFSSTLGIEPRTIHVLVQSSTD